MLDGATTATSIIFAAIKYTWLFLVGLIMWRSNSVQAMDKQTIDHESITNGLKHIGDAAGVSVGAVAAGDAIGVVGWLDLINPLIQTSIMLLTLIWMGYRIIEIRANIKAKRDDA